MNIGLFCAGYANELGEAFKSHIPRVGYLGSYLVASGYALGDASSKSQEMYQVGYYFCSDCYRAKRNLEISPSTYLSPHQHNNRGQLHTIVQ